MSADVCDNSRNMFLEIYELDPAKFLSASELAWQAPLKNTEVKLDLLIDIYMLLMVEKCITGRKPNYKCKKDYDKNEESSYLQY